MQSGSTPISAPPQQPAGTKVPPLQHRAQPCASLLAFEAAAKESIFFRLDEITLAFSCRVIPIRFAAWMACTHRESERERKLAPNVTVPHIPGSVFDGLHVGFREQMGNRSVSP